MKTEKNNGYWIIKNDKGQTFFTKEFNKITYKTKKEALFFINTMKAILRDGGKIPYNIMF